MHSVSDNEFQDVLRLVLARARHLKQGRPRLKGVTCFCATSIRVSRAIDVLRLCADLCEFDEIVLATHEDIPARRVPFLRVVPIRQIKDKRSYSQLILDGLKKIIRTDYVLIVQDDGFILNPGAWNEDFYNFDYIGSPWPPTLIFQSDSRVLQMNNRVGNGGFSFRSRRLLHECSVKKMYRPEYGTMVEDILIGHFNYSDLVTKGIRFADLSLASCFAGESPSDGAFVHLDKIFGFHGKAILDALVVKIRRR